MKKDITERRKNAAHLMANTVEKRARELSKKVHGKSFNGVDEMAIFMGIATAMAYWLSAEPPEHAELGISRFAQFFWSQYVSIRNQKSPPGDSEGAVSLP